MGTKVGTGSPQLHGDIHLPDTPWVLGSPGQVAQPSPTFVCETQLKVVFPPRKFGGRNVFPFLPAPKGDLLPLGEPWKDQYSDSEW